MNIVVRSNLPVEGDRDQCKHWRSDRPESNEVWRHTQFQTKRPIGIEHVYKVR